MKSRPLTDLQRWVLVCMNGGWVCHWNGSWNYIQDPSDTDTWNRISGNTLTSLERRGLITKFPHTITPVGRDAVGEIR